MYEQVLVAHGVDKYIHSTRYKDCLLEPIPGLCESWNGRDILLSLDAEAGRALFEACESSCMKKSMVLAKAAHINRNDIFQENVKFEGDFSRSKKDMLIPFSIQQLVELILEGSVRKSVAAQQIANDINRLLMFNCVKTKRREVKARSVILRT